MDKANDTKQNKGMIIIVVFAFQELKSFGNFLFAVKAAHSLLKANFFIIIPMIIAHPCAIVVMNGSETK